MCMKSFKVIRRFTHTWIKPTGYDTGIKIYNCVAKEKVPFIVKNKKCVKWYTCGPTVYDSSHIGHASCYVKLDIIQRILRKHFNLNLATVMNITDIDDKIINRSNEIKRSPLDIARHYEKEFWHDLRLLGVNDPNYILRVTENVNIIVDFIRKLLNTGYAYRSPCGSVYFNTLKLTLYGKLQNISRLEDSESNFKRSPMDFALWKGKKPDEPFWETDWGPGRPGWHIECSALAGTTLGDEIDVHAGGIDLQFPHHENEEAQSCAYFSKPQWINYWIHTGHLHLKDSIKMSKSLKNTISISDMLKICNPEEFRMACLMSHYSKNMEFSNELIQSARNSLQNYKNFIENCLAFLNGHLKATINDDILKKNLIKLSDDVQNAFCDDFNTTTALKNLNSLTTCINKMLHSSTSSVTNELQNNANLIASLNYVLDIFATFGINLQTESMEVGENSDFKDVLDSLIKFRQDVRLTALENKDTEYLKYCDELRDTLKQCGITIKDYAKTSTWTR